MSGMLTLFDATYADEIAGECRTCTRPAEERRYCSYWCHLVENGPDFFTLESITPWLASNRAPLKPRRY